MPQAYSMEFRRAVAADYDDCLSSDDVAERMGCSASWVRRLIQRRDANPASLGGGGDDHDTALAPLTPRRPDNNKLTDADREQLRSLIAAKPDMTLVELAAALGRKVGMTTVWRATVRLGLPRKKSRSTPPSRTAPT
jgi:transposase